MESTAMDFDLLNNPHQHPLFFIEEWNNDGEQNFCRRCRQPLRPPAFTCSAAACNFHIHQSCIDLPPQIHSPFHPQHPLTRTTNNLFCTPCWQMPSGDVYQCRTCSFQIDIRCAIAATKAAGVRRTSGNEFRHFNHPHPLTFQLGRNRGIDGIACVVCGLVIDSGSSCYFCSESDCNAHFHQHCAELPREMLNPNFHEHALFLFPDVSSAKSICNSCKNDCGEFVYNCPLCDFNLHVACLESFNHKHTFAKFRNKREFVCRACGEMGNGFSWYCTVCHVLVHRVCAELPLTLRTFGHRFHDLSLTYFRDFVSDNIGCKICGEEIKTKYAGYGCYECRYFVHLDCARWQSIDLNSTKDPDESTDDEDAQIEISGSEIQHFIHPHKLRLCSDELGQDRVCDGCMNCLSGSSYGCEECDFFVHKECLELPRKKRNFIHQHKLNLISIPNFIFQCKACLKHFNGFAYHCTTCLSTFDTRCASIKIPFKHPGHQHPLSLDRTNQDHKCEGCKEGVKDKLVFRCVRCKFYLDAGCATLPLGVRYRFDRHPLNLTFVDEEEEEYCCDVCEEERESGPWFYGCQKCCFAGHVDCTIGMFPFLKSTKHEAHKHQLKLRMNGKKGDCRACGESCAADLAYECIENCKFNVHANGLCYQRQVVQGSLSFTNRCSYSRGVGLHQHTIQNGQSIIKFGPYGGNGGSPWTEKVFSTIRAFAIYHQEWIYSFQLQYEKNGELIWSTMHGERGGSKSEVVFDHPNEYLVSISGSYSDISNRGLAAIIVRSLTLRTNKRTYGPFGKEDGTTFSFPMGMKFSGLHGSSGLYLDAIGLYTISKHQIQVERSKLRQYGGGGGSAWEDTFRTMRKFVVYHGSWIDSIQIQYEDDNENVVWSKRHGGGGGSRSEVVLEFPSEYLVSIHGYYSSVIQSLTLETNKKTYGPFGVEDGSKFSFPSVGMKVVGIHGKSGAYLDAIGLYVEESIQDYSVEDESGEYYCNVCEEERTPTVCFYYCKTCGLNHWGSIHHLLALVKEVKMNYSLNVSAASSMRTLLSTVTTSRSTQSDRFSAIQAIGHFLLLHTVKTYAVVLDYPNEYLISISGFYGNVEDSGWLDAAGIRSLTLVTNRRTYGPFGSDWGMEFSSPIMGAKIVAFHGRGSLLLEAIGVYIHPIPKNQLNHFSLGPFGGEGGQPWQCVFRSIRRFVVNHEQWIYSIQMQYEDKEGELVWSDKHGDKDGSSISESSEVVVEFPDEHFVSIHGYYCDVIRSLTFETNRRTFGPYGVEEGTKFSFPIVGTKIVGVYGRSDSNLDAIGLYLQTTQKTNVESELEPEPEPAPATQKPRKLMQYGGEGGDGWEDTFWTIRRLVVYHGLRIDSIQIQYEDDYGNIKWSKKHGGDGGSRIEVDFGFPDEHLVSIHGYYGDFIQSLTIETNKQTYGPYGVEEGTKFSYQKDGVNVVGIHGRSSTYLHAIGLYVVST